LLEIKKEKTTTWKNEGKNPTEIEDGENIHTDTRKKRRKNMTHDKTKR
jgi:hypothetical protein